ncbi:hypothetical protein DXG01_010956 [Tephrocybe rancida]|nr:hypothetical protein DXG01_010956 [Tephrocybe rancida]
MPSTLTHVTKAATELGGPSVSVNNIEWATKIPAGAKLIQWLVDQCVADDAEGEVQNLDEIGAALRSVALERDESLILNTATDSQKIRSDQPQNTILGPSMYDSPTHLRKHANFVDNDTHLLEANNLAIRSRLKQTKRATQATQREISSLKKAIEHQDTIIDRAQEQLAELSILADTALASGANTAETLLDTLALPQHLWAHHEQHETPIAHPSLQSSTQFLSTLASFRTSFVENYTSLQEHLPPQLSKELLKDSASLLRALSQLSRDKRLQESAYALELRRLYEMLDQEGNLPDLHMPQENHDDDGSAGGSDAMALIEKAWAFDQASRLDAESAILASANNEYKTTLLPALEALHTQLSTREQAVRAAEALVGAFGIEIEGLSSSANGSTHGESLDRDLPDVGDEESLEHQLKTLLSQEHPDCKDAAPLLVVEKGDILGELRRLRALSAGPGEISDWKEVGRIKETLSLMNVTHHPLLSTLYGLDGVQTNSSPPFRGTTAAEEVDQRAHNAAARLEGGVKLGEELDHIISSKRTQRKLGDFVDRHKLIKPLEKGR